MNYKLHGNEISSTHQVYQVCAVFTQIISSDEQRDDLPVVLEINTLERERERDLWMLLSVCVSLFVLTLLNASMLHCAVYHII